MRMKAKKVSLFAVSASMVFGFLSLAALPAHAATEDAATSDATISKQEAKARKKAERQARRAKKNAELSKLEQNGYRPNGSQTDYPQNIQKAQQKASGQ
jgi:uncharacterized caspase-like protein